MTIGVGTYDPQAKFWFPRSYVFGLYFATYLGNTVTHVAGRYTVAAVPPDPTFAVMQLSNDFYLWSSKARSLDYIVTEFWYKSGGTGPELPLPFKLSYINDAPHNRQALKFEWATFSPVFVYNAFPSQPLNYWRPPPLP